MRRARRDEEFTAWAGLAQQQLFRKACLLTGERESARDLVQQVLLSTHLAWSKVEHPSAYARTSLVRAFLKVAKDRRREVLFEEVTESGAPAEDRETSLVLLQALGDLPPRMRATVMLRFWDDLSVQETAELLGCTDGTVKSATSKALAHLRRRFGEDLEIDSFTDHAHTATPTTTHSRRRR